MVDEPWGPLPLSALETPTHRGKFIDIETVGAVIQNATIDVATITDATIVNATITSGSMVDLDVTGTLSLTGTGEIVSAASAPRLIIQPWNSGSAGSPLEFFSGHTNEQFSGKITLNADANEAWLNARGPTIGPNGSNYGYGYFQGGGSSLSSYGVAGIGSLGIGTYEGLTEVVATTTGSGNANINIMATSGSGTPTIRLKLNGTTYIDLATDGYFGSGVATGTPQLKVDAAGSATTPAYAFQGTTNMGMYRLSSTALGFATSGGRQFAIGTDGISVGSGATNGQPYMVDTAGSASNPVYTFVGMSDSGMYRIADGYIGMSTNGRLNQQWGYAGSGNNEWYAYFVPSDASDPYMRIDTSTGRIQYDSSSRDIKENIHSLVLDDRYDALSPVVYDFIGRKGRGLFGFVAEDVADVYPNLGQWGHESPSPDNKDEDKKIVGYDPKGIAALNTLAVQDLRKRVNDLEERLSANGI